MTERLAFVAGAGGAVGRTLVRIAAAEGIVLRPHYRKAPEGVAPAGAVVCGLDDGPRLQEGLRDATTVIQLIGTMRKRFAAGDTYETSDIGTTAALVEAARAVGGVDHLILLSSVGAGRPVGAYLHAKAKAEAIVRDSGIPFTIFRPSAFDGEGHHAPPGAGLLSRLPGLAGFRPIRVEALARAILHVAQMRSPIEAELQGDALFRVVDAATGG